MVAIIDYGMGNSNSVQKAFESLGIKSIITNKELEIISSSKIVIPGVGAFGDAISALNTLNIFELIKDEALNKKKPLLGICLGMQLLARASMESKGFEGFGFIETVCKKFECDLKIPHVGWNDIEITKKDSLLFKNIPDHSDFYFVHSYHFDANIAQKSSVVEYGYPFASSLELDNIFGVQFHPEKSQKYGLEILKNFGEL